MTREYVLSGSDGGSSGVSLVVGADLVFTAARRRDGTVVAAESQVFRIPLASIDHLLEFFDPGSEGDSEARLVRVMTERLADERSTDPGGLAFRLRFWFRHAGVSYELAKANEAGESRVAERLEVVRRFPRDSDGLLRTFTVELDPETTWERSRIVFNELYERADEIIGYSHNVSTTRIEIAALFDQQLPEPDEVIAAFRTRVEHGEFKPREARDSVAAWLEEAGVKCSRNGVNRVVPLPVDGLQLTIKSDRSVDFQASSDTEPGTFYLQTKLDSAAPILECLTRHAPTGDGPHGDGPLDDGAPEAGVLEDDRVEGGLVEDSTLDDRLIAAFVGLAVGRQLDGSPMAVRDRVARWYAEAGLPYTTRAFGRRRDVELLSVHRERTNCIFTLTVYLDPDREDEGIGLGEMYDYLATRSDAGREYAYTTYAPYSSLERLVAYFEKDDVREGNLEDRLIARFADLAARGELGNHLPIKENHDRAAAWFAAAGVPAKKSTWSWVNSD